MVITPGRTLPWVDEAFNYEFPGGLEPGEERHLSLEPNAFSDWGNSDLSDRNDLVLTIVITGLEDAEGRVFKDDSKDRMLELRQRLLALTAQRDAVLRSIGSTTEEATAPNGATINATE